MKQSHVDGNNQTLKYFSLSLMAGVGAGVLTGCHGPRPVAAPMAPPVAQYAPPLNNGMNGGMNGSMNPGMNGSANGMGGANIPVSVGQGGVYNWQDVPVGQQVTVTQAQFDQGGYQLVTDSGDTIVVPFVNQNLYVMRFGRSNGPTYFVNESGVPTLYLAPNAGLANAGAQGALWYPLPAAYNYTRPVYVGLAPTWNDYIGMGWYPGMMMYGGLYGYSPYHVGWMPGFNIFIGGSRYNSWGGYHTYYSSHPGYYRPSIVNNYYNTRPRGSGSYRYSGGTGSYRTGSSGSYRPSNGGSFSRPSGTFNSGAAGGFGGARPSGSYRSSGTASGTFNPGGYRPSGTFNSGGATFGGGRASAPTGGSFGGGSRPSGSFGGGSSGYSAPARPSGGSFGGGFSRPSGGGFSRPSGGGSFGGGGRSSGSFGGGRGR